jgi:PAS domain S-box-containing protein
VENGPGLIRRIRADGGCDYANEAWLEFTGRPFEQVTGSGWTKSIHPDDLPVCLRTRSQNADGQWSDIEYRLRRRDGSYRYVTEHATPWVDPAGDSGGIICFCFDIQDLKDAAATTTPFLRMMAHELRTPLSAMRLFAEVMRRTAARGTLNPPESFAKLEAQIDRLDRLVEVLLRSSPASEIELTLESVELGEVIRRVVDMRGRVPPENLKEPRHWVVVSGADHARWVRADRSRLEQVFASLLDNAIKYSPRGGTIQIALGDGEGMHCVSIEDPGIGIPPDEIPILTRRFFRGRNAPPESFPGLGLGLSFASEIVGRHGGLLTIQSELDKGTEATVCLPPAPPPRSGLGPNKPLKTQGVGEEPSAAV